MRVHTGGLSFAPRLPGGLSRLAFRLVFRGRRLRIEVDHDQARYALMEGDPLEIAHEGEAITVTTDEPVIRPVSTPPPREPPRQPPGRAPAKRWSPMHSAAG
jgi:alpha,alpha-trehalose phosphorylase